jgi:hypothetical protein
VSTTVSTTTETSAWGSVCHRASFVDEEVPATEFFSVEHRNCGVGFLVVIKLDETESSGATSHFIGNDGS